MSFMISDQQHLTVNNLFLNLAKNRSSFLGLIFTTSSAYWQGQIATCKCRGSKYIPFSSKIQSSRRRKKSLPHRCEYRRNNTSALPLSYNIFIIICFIHRLVLITLKANRFIAIFGMFYEACFQNTRGQLKFSTV